MAMKIVVVTHPDQLITSLIKEITALKPMLTSEDSAFLTLKVMETFPVEKAQTSTTMDTISTMRPQPKLNKSKMMWNLATRV